MHDKNKYIGKIIYKLEAHKKSGNADRFEECAESIRNVNKYYKSAEQQFDSVLSKIEHTDQCGKGTYIVERLHVKFSVYENTNQSKVRRRFTAAHELGHYLLHGDILVGKGKISDNRLYRDEPGSVRYFYNFI